MPYVASLPFALESLTAWFMITLIRNFASHDRRGLVGSCCLHHLLKHAIPPRAVIFAPCTLCCLRAPLTHEVRRMDPDVSLVVAFRLQASLRPCQSSLDLGFAHVPVRTQSLFQLQNGPYVYELHSSSVSHDFCEYVKDILEMGLGRFE